MGLTGDSEKGTERTVFETLTGFSSPARLSRGIADHSGLTLDPERPQAAILYGVDITTGDVLFRKTLPWPVSENRRYRRWDEAPDFVCGPDGFVWTFLKDVLVRIRPERRRRPCRGQDLCSRQAHVRRQRRVLHRHATLAPGPQHCSVSVTVERRKPDSGGKKRPNQQKTVDVSHGVGKPAPSNPDGGLGRVSAQ